MTGEREENEYGGCTKCVRIEYLTVVTKESADACTGGDTLIQKSARLTRVPATTVRKLQPRQGQVPDTTP